MMQKDGVRFVTKQRNWLHLEGMKRITKLLFPDLIMVESERYEMGIDNIDQMTIEQLQRELWSRNVQAQGKKQDLQQRLRDYMNGDRCISAFCECKIGVEYKWLEDIPPCYRTKRLEARKRRSEYISFGFCRRMEKQHISSDLTATNSRHGVDTLQQGQSIIPTHVPLVLKQLIRHYYDMIMY